MNKYKPTGWKYESQRHSLAAKGIKTKFSYDELASMRYLLKYKVQPLQSAYATDKKKSLVKKLDNEMKKIENDGIDYAKKVSIPKTEDGLWSIKNPSKKVYWHPDYGVMKFENAGGTNVKNRVDRLVLRDKKGEVYDFEPLHNDPVKIMRG